MAKRQIIIVPNGGMNNADPALDVPAERALIANNYELNTRGRFRRVDGFERFDGQPRPSDFEPPAETPDEDYLTELRAGVDLRRADIEPVPGYGAVRGLAVYGGKVYAWRRASSNPAVLDVSCYSSSPTGWSSAISSMARTLAAGDRVRTSQANFQSGGSRGQRLYVAGKTAGTGTVYTLEFNGTTATDIGPSAPGVYSTRVVEHKNHLFQAFPSGSLVNSATGDPTTYAGSGAAEISLPSDITDLAVLPGGALAIFCKDRIEVLYGEDTDNWVKQVYSTTAGAVGDTVQVLGDALFLSDEDVTFLQRTQAYGDLRGTGIASDIRPLMQEAKSLVVGSCVLQRKAQYRIYLSDGRVLCCTFGGGKPLGWTMMDMGTGISCVAVGTINGEERVFVGADNGYVYETDVARARSFDGASIQSQLVLSYANCGAPGAMKRFHEVAIEGVASESTELTMVPDFSYSNSDDAPISENYPFQMLGIEGAGRWDLGDWDEMLWDRTVSQRNVIPVFGTGHNISIGIYGDSDFSLSHSILAITVTYAIRGRKE